MKIRSNLPRITRIDKQHKFLVKKSLKDKVCSTRSSETLTDAMLHPRS
jgi:hypothetical protein